MKKVRFLTFLFFIVMLAGCSQSQPETGGQQPDPERSEDKPETRTVVHSLGQSTIPSDPQRIAVTHQVLIDWLHPLGYKVSVSPKASPTQDFEPYTPQEQRQGMTLIGPPGDPNLEAFLAQEPDVIFVNWNHDKVFDQLSRIAPSIFVAFENDWRELLRQYGRMLHKESLAEEWLSDYERKSEAARAALAPVKDESVVFIRFLPRDLRIYTNHSTSSVGGVLYHDLGLKPVTPPSSEALYEAISLEGLAQLNPDHIFMQIGFVPESDEEATKRYMEIVEGNVWKSISAVQKDQIYLVESAFFSNTPLAKSHTIDVVLDKLTGN